MNGRLRLGVLTSLLCFALVVSPAYADSSSQSSSDSSSEKGLSDLKLDYKYMTGHKNRTYDQMYQEFLEEGLSQEDSEYYAKLDILVNQVEEQKINVEKDLKKVEKIDTKYARLHPDEVRNLALEKDPKALKTILSQNQSISLGFDESKEISRTLDKQGNGFKVVIEYEDGSKFIQSSFTSKCEEQPESSTVVPNTSTMVPGPWDSCTMFASNYNISSSGTYATNSTWQYLNASGFAKVKDLFTWDLDFPNMKATYRSDSGASSYSGIVSIDKEYLSNHQNTTAYGAAGYIQGYTDTVFKVSSSFAASIPGLSISVSSGAAWHEYSITEINGWGDTYSYAGQFI